MNQKIAHKTIYMDKGDHLEFDLESSESESSSKIVIKKQDDVVENKNSEQYNPLLSAYIPRLDGVEIFDLDVETLENKPWLRPGADIEDYFNYGFDENSWKMYCAKQKVLREENGKMIYRVRRDDKKKDIKRDDKKINYIEGDQKDKEIPKNIGLSQPRNYKTINPEHNTLKKNEYLERNNKESNRYLGVYDEKRNNSLRDRGTDHTRNDINKDEIDYHRRNDDYQRNDEIWDRRNTRELNRRDLDNSRRNNEYTSRDSYARQNSEYSRRDDENFRRERDDYYFNQNIRREDDLYRRDRSLPPRDYNNYKDDRSRRDNERRR